MCGLFKKCSQWLQLPGFLFALTIAVVVPATTLAALLDNNLEHPLLSFNFNGTTDYYAVPQQFIVVASPLAILIDKSSFPLFIDPIVDGQEVLQIDIRVDDAGTLIGGAPGDDLLVKGVVLLGGESYSGVLLTGEVTGFGHQDSGGPTDFYDFTFTVTGGLLSNQTNGAGVYDIDTVVGVTVTSETSDFTGNFTINFDGEAKGTLGQIFASLGDRVWEDLDNDGIQDCTDDGSDGIIGNAGDSGPECNTGIADVVVKLGADVNGTCIPFNTLETTTDTNSDGFYLFDNLVPGEYCVLFTKPDAATYPELCKEIQNGETYYLGEPQFTDQGVGVDPEKDSNADQVTGATDFVTLLSGDNNLSVDAGIVCPAKIGNFVWEDQNKDGLQDSEPGIDGVTVELWNCGVDGIAGTYTGQTRITADGGYYMFGAEPGVYDLPPGSYFVKFLKLDGEEFTTPDIGQPDAGEADGDPANDSDCTSVNGDENTGISSCVTLGSGEVNVKRDCGLTVPECGLGIEKKCLIEPEPTLSFDKCDGKLKQFTVVWNGLETNLTGVNMGDYATPLGGGIVATGDEVVFSGPYASNDVVVTGDFGQSTFHMSCSDDDFNDPLDCGKTAGNGKDNNSGVDGWTLEGFIDNSGRVLDCNPDNGDDFAASCAFTKQPEPSCETIKDPEMLTWRYDGGGNNDGDCSGSTFDIQKDFECTGSVEESDPVTVTPREGSPLVDVQPGAEFTISLNASKEMTLSQISGVQDLVLHTSCSQPIEVGLTAGALTLVAMDGQDGGVGVSYQYTVSTTGALTGVTVVDNLLGQIGEPFDLAANGMTSLTTDIIRITENTSNYATASAGEGCTATSDVVHVIAHEPTCDVAVVFDKFEEDKVKYKLTNTSSIVATLDTLTLGDFPAANGTVKEVKLDGGIYKANESSLVVGPGGTIGSLYWTKSDVSKRELDPGETRTLEIVFSDKYDGSEWLTITTLGGAVFEETCGIDLAAPPACAFGKPTELVFEHTGNDCSVISNTQEGKFVCTESGALSGPLVEVIMDKDANKFIAGTDGNTVTITYNDKPGEHFPSEIKYTIVGSNGEQSHVLHTSCSKPLAVGDVFGGLTLKNVVLAD